jgi:hypothetical protein
MVDTSNDQTSGAADGSSHVPSHSLRHQNQLHAAAFRWENPMNRWHLSILLAAGLAVLLMVIFIVHCPPDACRALHIQTYTISSLDDYRQFLQDEAAFTSLHNVRAVRLHCASLRDEIVAALKTDRLTLGTSHQSGAEDEKARRDTIQAWHQGRLLHLSKGTSENHQELDAWIMRVRESLTDRTKKDLSFLPRLFGGVILHVQNRQIPIVLFSDQPCI